jgi:hypothetical protein
MLPISCPNASLAHGSQSRGGAAPKASPQALTTLIAQRVPGVGHRFVRTGTAADLIGAATPGVDVVVAGPAGISVGLNVWLGRAAPAGDEVPPGAADRNVGAGARVEEVTSAAAEEAVGPRAALQLVFPFGAEQRVQAAVAREKQGADQAAVAIKRSGVEHVAATPAVDLEFDRMRRRGDDQVGVARITAR